GYELWVKAAHLTRLFDDLMDAGAAFGIRPFGSRALNSLRLEKNYGSWAREYRPLYGPLETGLDRFVAYDKSIDFIGKDAAVADRLSGGSKRLISLAVSAADADVIGDEPVFFKGAVAGWVTSGGYAHASDISVALAMVDKDHANQIDGWTIELLGQMLPAKRLERPLFDPAGTHMRA
ncbi:MAG: glycine cleavage T C-terminal barrel domain-containing protein, partial [Candidatus Puniceispirillum sp.]